MGRAAAHAVNDGEIPEGLVEFSEILPWLLGWEQVRKVEPGSIIDLMIGSGWEEEL